MQQTLGRYGIMAFITVVICVTVISIMSLRAQQVFGSVNDSSNSYEATSTRTATLGAALTSPTTLSLGFGTLGSVVITGAGTGVINLYDGTSTAPHSDYGTTTLATFPASTAAGTYVFDVQYKKGLVFEVVGTVGTSTITWKK